MPAASSGKNLHQNQLVFKFGIYSPVQPEVRITGLESTGVSLFGPDVKLSKWLLSGCCQLKWTVGMRHSRPWLLDPISTARTTASLPASRPAGTVADLVVSMCCTCLSSCG